MARNSLGRGRAGLDRKPKALDAPRYQVGWENPMGGTVVAIIGERISNQERREWEYKCACSVCGAHILKGQEQINAMLRTKRGIFCRKCGYAKARYYATPEEETEADEENELGRPKPKIDHKKWKSAAIAASPPWFPSALLGGERPRLQLVRPGGCL